MIWEDIQWMLERAGSIDVKRVAFPLPLSKVGDGCGFSPADGCPVEDSNETAARWQTT